MNDGVTFDELILSLTDLMDTALTSPSVREQPEQFVADALRGQIDHTVQQLRALPEISRETLASLVQANPDSVPILASCIGLGQEQLKNQLRHRLGSSGWISLARMNPTKLIDTLDGHYHLVMHLREQLHKEWTFGDALLERYLWSRKTARGAIGRGRRLEDEVEQIVHGLGLSCRMRTQFTGRGGQSAPCDLAIPGRTTHCRCCERVQLNRKQVKRFGAGNC